MSFIESVLLAVAVLLGLALTFGLIFSIYFSYKRKYTEDLIHTFGELLITIGKSIGESNKEE